MPAKLSMLESLPSELQLMVLRKDLGPLDFVHLLQASKYFREHYLRICEEICTTITLDQLRKKNMDLLPTTYFNVIEFTLSTKFSQRLVSPTFFTVQDVASASSSVFRQAAEGGKIVLGFRDALALSTIIHIERFHVEHQGDGKLVTHYEDVSIDIETKFPGHSHFIQFLRPDGKDITNELDGDYPFYMLAALDWYLLAMLFKRSR